MSLPSKMHALTLHQPQQDFSLQQDSLVLPTIGDRQLLIKVEYAGLNPVDTKLAYHGHTQWQYPHIPALDGVGVVVDSFVAHCPLIGKRVMWHGDLTKHGALAQYVTVDAHAVAVVPDCISPRDAATLPCAGMTAALALCKLQLKAGETILIEAGAGGVGQFAIQLAKAQELTVYTTASKSNHKYLKKLGADEVFDYKDPQLALKLERALGVQRLDGVLDAVGGESTERNIKLLKFNGQIACLNPLPSLEQALLFAKSPTIHVVSLGGAWLSNDICAQHKLGMKGEHLLSLLAQQTIRVPPISVIDFNAQAVTSAMHNQLTGGVCGKQIVEINI